MKGASFHFNGGGSSFEGMSMDDILNQFGFGGFGDPFTRARTRPQAVKGESLRVKLSLSLEEIYSGVKKKISLVLLVEEVARPQIPLRLTVLHVAALERYSIPKASCKPSKLAQLVAELEKSLRTLAHIAMEAVSYKKYLKLRLTFQRGLSMEPNLL